MRGSPYQFLGYYDFEDRQRFFGRSREIRILLADVIVSRLVVLFARTGTGKTSLINAGVRPELEDRGYATFVARVGDDPARSALEQLAADKRIGRLSGNGFSGNLRSAARRLGQPVVLFFDQFEEFFIYVMRRPHDGRSVAARFISDVAEIH